MNKRSMKHVKGFCSILGALVLGTMGCELIVKPNRDAIDESPGVPATSGAGGSTASSSGMGGMGGAGMGGAGGAPECTVASDCADPGNECLVRACTADGKCVPDPAAAGTPSMGQKPGDCQKVVCDGAGATTSQADDTDLPNDGKECTTDVCTAGVPSHTSVALNTGCGAGGALYCDGNGACVGCTGDVQCGAPADCSTPRCMAGACTTEFTAPGTAIPAQTAGDCLEVQCDGLGGTKSSVANADITDDGNDCTSDVCAGGAATHPNKASGVACASNGGAHCNGAGACVECITGNDCASFVCTSQTCAAPTCSDAVKNANETDVDCGGGSCGPCANTKGCAIAGDCVSQVCSGQPLKCQAPTCGDSVKNGTETDVDCGGAACPKCGPTKACTLNADCLGGSCVGNTCVPTCSDQAKNGMETDVDCGGPVCGGCGGGKVCSGNTDCTSGSCVAGICGAPPCMNGIKDGAETDVDCGGPTCAACAVGKACLVSSDCAGGSCAANVCVPFDNEPTNNTCDGATAAPLPATLTPLALPTVADVDWFLFTATAADVGKVVHVVTTSPVPPGNPCDTVVEVFTGSCASLTTLGGPSDDQNYAEDWLSTPIPAPGPIWVQVTYSSFGFSTAAYTLLVNTQ